jgi:hypothetical protein
MDFRGQVTGVLLAAIVIALFAAGCGSSSSDASGAESAKADEIELASPSEGEPSKAFLKKSSEGKIPKFGDEASAKEREAATTVLEENLEAREAGEWAKQCATLTPGAIKEVKEGASAQGVKQGSCASELKGRAEPLQQSKSIRENSMNGPIDALRAKGSRAYALYHGVGGIDYAMPMEKVDGEWKVDAILEATP